ncbi:MAG: ribonuclease P protein component [Cyanobacteria bacterium SID2]|nr:ribonuclease P protein component [Cyanobacteria bacterium SID2]MBP0003456.1 ribonuclease P protein component [Cyanobacteria bacterium SBC]
MLPKAHRLRHWKDFQTVYKNGIRCRGKRLALRAYHRRSVPPQDNDEQSVAEVLPTRIGISIGRKVSKRAVVRNRIKRQIRAAARQILPYLSPGWDVVAVALPDAKECNSHQFLQELEQLLAKAEVLNGHSRGSLV